MGIARTKPFTLLAAFFIVPLLILAFTTKQNACEGQLDSLDYTKSGDFSTWCSDQCSDDVASRKIAYISSVGTSDSMTGASNSPKTVAVEVFIKCGWGGRTGRLLLAFVCLAAVWVALELFLAVNRKYSFLINLALILIIGLGIPAAIFQLSDVSNRNCSPITTPEGTAQDTLCYTGLFSVSFVFTVVTMVLLLNQLFYNFIRIKHINHPKYAGIAQGTNLANDNVPLIINHDSKRLR